MHIAWVLLRQKFTLVINNATHVMLFSEYLQIKSRGGFKSRSQELFVYVCQSFAVPEASYTVEPG